MFSFLENFWLIQAIGAIALILLVLAWNASTRRKILLLQSVSLMFFIVHYTLLSALAGAAMSVVTLGRNFVLLQKKGKNWASHPAWFYFFISFSIVMLAFFWNGWISALPVLGAIVGIYGMWKENPAEIRYYMLIASSIWIPYTIAVHSYSGLLSQVIGIAGILVGMYRFDMKEVLPS